MENMFFLISVLTILGGFVIAGLAIVTDHKQKMLMIEKGLIEEKKPLPGLRSGLTFTLLGCICLLIFWEWQSILGPIPWYSPGGVLLALGLAQLGYYGLMRKDMRRVEKKYPSRAV